VIAVRDEPRVAVVAVLDAPSGRFTACTTHLSFVPGVNRWQLHRLVRALPTAPGPLIVTGDLNLGPRPAGRITRLRPLAAAATFPADRPRRQLDHVLAGDGVRAAGPAQALRLPVSDHRALVVACELG
jgi:endonuclease/exonuclease/phosphatase family metal-dependent hydrolase